MRLEINVTNKRTGAPIDGATVTVSATDTGPSDTDDGPSADDDSDDSTGESIETTSVDEYNGVAAFEIASWVNEIEYEVSHDRFETERESFSPSATDKELDVELTPKVSDITIHVSDLFREPPTIRFTPADELLEKLYDAEATVEMMPGETKTFSLITGRYQFMIKNVPDDYCGDMGHAVNFKHNHPDRIEFGGFEQEPMEEDGAPDSDGQEFDSQEPPQEESDEQGTSGVREAFRGMLPSINNGSEPEPEDPISGQETESGGNDENTEDPLSTPVDEIASADAPDMESDGESEAESEDGDDIEAGDSEDDEDNETETEGEDEDAEGLGALFN